MQISVQNNLHQNMFMTVKRFNKHHQLTWLCLLNLNFPNDELNLLWLVSRR